MPQDSRPTDLFAAAEVEVDLRARLEHERSRVAALERELEDLRSSESYKVGHALVQGFNRRVRRRPSAHFRSLYRRITGRAARRRSVQGQGQVDEPDLPSKTVLFVAWGVDEARLSRYAERVAQMQTVLVDFNPLFLIDTFAVESLRDRGFAFEYVASLDEWAEHRPRHEWGAYVTGRVAALRARHRPRTVVVLDGAGPGSALERGVIDTLIIPAIGAGEDNLLST